MADLFFLFYALAALFVFLLIGLEEVPWKINVLRVARRARISARRRKTTPHEALERIRRQTHWGGRVLAVFGVASALWFLIAAMQGRFIDAGALVLAATLAAGLCFLSFMFMVWAPRLFRAV